MYSHLRSYSRLNPSFSSAFPYERRSCERITILPGILCPPPSPVKDAVKDSGHCTHADGRIAERSFDYETRCKFECRQGYELQGSAERWCQANGGWSGTPTECASKWSNMGLLYTQQVLDTRLDIVRRPIASRIPSTVLQGLIQPAIMICSYTGRRTSLVWTRFIRGLRYFGVTVNPLFFLVN